MRLGFPRAMNYHDYYPFWAGFFQALGVELVLSPPTNRQTMETGLKKAYTEMCLPIKILAGHLDAFADVDGVFLPRMVSMEEKTYLCPKMLGLPESILSAVPEGLKVYSVTVNRREGDREARAALEKFGRPLGYGRRKVGAAYVQGKEWQTKYEKERAMEWNGRDKDPDKTHIALIGHSYLTNEPYVNHNMLKRLEKRACVSVAENVAAADRQVYLDKLRKPLFWSHAQKIYGAASFYLENEGIDGVICLSCFGCGSDSMTQEFIANQARRVHKPYMVITLDEHTGEAGIITRLEAFLDMIERRKKYENNLSAYGECLDRDSNLV